MEKIFNEIEIYEYFSWVSKNIKKVELSIINQRLLLISVLMIIEKYNMHEG